MLTFPFYCSEIGSPRYITGNLSSNLAIFVSLLHWLHMRGKERSVFKNNIYWKIHNFRKYLQNIVHCISRFPMNFATCNRKTKIILVKNGWAFFLLQFCCKIGIAIKKKKDWDSWPLNYKYWSMYFYYWELLTIFLFLSRYTNYTRERFDMGIMPSHIVIKRTGAHSAPFRILRRPLSFAAKRSFLV